MIINDVHEISDNDSMVNNKRTMKPFDDSIRDLGTGSDGLIRSSDENAKKVEVNKQPSLVDSYSMSAIDDSATHIF